MFKANFLAKMAHRKIDLEQYRGKIARLNFAKISNDQLLII